MLKILVETKLIHTNVQYTITLVGDKLIELECIQAKCTTFGLAIISKESLGKPKPMFKIVMAIEINGTIAENRFTVTDTAYELHKQLKVEFDLTHIPYTMKETNNLKRIFIKQMF